MSERPNIILGALLGISALFAAVLTARLIFFGAAGTFELTAMVVGAFSACIYFLAELRQLPIAAVVLVMLVVSSCGALAWNALTYVRQRRVLNGLPLEPMQGPLADVARQAGATTLYRTPAQRPAAFCFGLRKPSVVVTDGLLDQLNPSEQAAAVWHEAQHARVREPLKCLTARLAAKTFFWMPLVSDLLQRYLLVKELDADRTAAGQTSPRALAGALCQVIGAPTPAGTVGLSDYAAARVDRLFNESAPLPPLTKPHRVVLSAIAAAAFVLAVFVPAHLQGGESAHLHGMLTSMSLHGLPGMAGGLLVNALILTCMGFSARRLLRSRND